MPASQLFPSSDARLDRSLVPAASRRVDEDARPIAPNLTGGGATSEPTVLACGQERRGERSCHICTVIRLEPLPELRYLAIVDRKVGRTSSTGGDGVRTASLPAIGKRPLVEAVPAIPSELIGVGLPRLQLRDVPPGGSATPERHEVHEGAANATAGIAAGKQPDEPPVQRKASQTGKREAAVQRVPAAPGAGSNASVADPKSGINKAGFIDHGDGANIRTGPAESGGKTVRDQPLPPATRIFVSGTHPDAPQWWYVTAYLDKTMVRGYVQDFRVTTDLPEPTAKLHQVVSGDTAEKLAAQEYASSVRDGHDLRYYETRQDDQRAGTGRYTHPHGVQDPDTGLEWQGSCDGRPELDRELARRETGREREWCDVRDSHDEQAIWCWALEKIG
jgi:hypothetical protein